jgi:hypothetical protein
LTWWGSLVRVQSRLPNLLQLQSQNGLYKGRVFLPKEGYKGAPFTISLERQLLDQENCSNAGTITLPDGHQRVFDNPVSVRDVAAAIGPGLAKSALAGKVDGQLVDISHVLNQDANLAIITERDPEGLEVIRHSCAHLLAHAVKQLYPTAQVTIGPVIENGFYYDFAFERTFTPDDLERIQARMEELAAQDIPVEPAR